MSDTSDEVASSQCYVRSLVECMLRQMQSVVEAQRFWACYYRGQFLKIALAGAQELFHLLCA